MEVGRFHHSALASCYNVGKQSLSKPSISFTQSHTTGRQGNVVVKPTDIKIKLGIEKAEALFYSTSGVKQRDNLAPALFLFVIQATVETTHRKWSNMELSKPELLFYPNEDDGFLNKTFQKKGTRDTPF